MCVLESSKIELPPGYTGEINGLYDKESFALDICESDKFELGQTWRNNWSKELEDTLRNTAFVYRVESKDHNGCSIFGVTEHSNNIGQIWMLKTKTFIDDGKRVHGRKFLRYMTDTSVNIINVLRNKYDILFNFVPKKQKYIIKYLNRCGFMFLSNDSHNRDILFFGIGDKR